MIFAQANGRFGLPQDELRQEFRQDLLILALVALAIGVLVKFCYVRSLSKCFSLIEPQNRRMEPALVWLNLIPCFDLIWIFFTTTRLADSLRSEFHDRRMPGNDDFGRRLGIAYPILTLLAAIPGVGPLLGLASLLCWIIYWVKISAYSRMLLERSAGYTSARDLYTEGRANPDWDRDDFERERRVDHP